MSFAAPSLLVLLIPLVAMQLLFRSPRFNAGAALPGAWSDVVAPIFRPFAADRSRGVGPGSLLTLLVGALLIAALARPAVDLRSPEEFATLGGRVIVLDVGADLSRHRHLVEALKQADPGSATAVLAVAGDAYRLTPFTTDGAHVDRYVRVLSADMMPRPGKSPHLGLALGERLLEDAGFLVRQIVFLSARSAPEDVVLVPETGARRIFVDLEDGKSWEKWAEAQNAKVLSFDAVAEVADTFATAKRDAARAELPDATYDLQSPLIGLAAFLFLFRFRRQSQ